MNSKRDFLISTTPLGEKIFARVAGMSARATGRVVAELLIRIREGINEVRSLPSAIESNVAHDVLPMPDSASVFFYVIASATVTAGTSYFLSCGSQ